MRLWALRYFLHEPFKARVELEVKPCLKNYHLVREETWGMYRTQVYEGTRTDGVLMVWGRLR